ncbi:hypothetical protein R3X26_16925 [Vibrio sp. TH_r3]|uniref:hypothetical protein n=1 Tax=Vibrio sp. TH_r3 TaxID=3082084 RepID=UPI0029545EE1|nr:hypothetical protein [Vibrio sp. TH_r3]MDV7106084.1 hypothetical protein [Vibrio sp. TH_r3]
MEQNDNEPTLTESQFHMIASLCFPLDDESNGGLFQETLRLLSLLPPTIFDHFPELSLIKSKIRTLPFHSPRLDINVVYKTIADQGHLGEHFLSAFISCPFQTKQYTFNAYDDYKALCFALSLRLLLLGKHEAKIKDMCDEIRQIALGKRAYVVPYLPDNPFNNLPDFEDLLVSLTEGESGAAANITTISINKLNHFKRPIQAALKGQSGYHVNRSSSLKQPGKKLINVSTQVDDNLYIQQITFPTKRSQAWEEEESRSETKRTLMAVDNQHSHQNIHTQKMVARAVASQVLKRELFLSSDISAMTRKELEVLLKHTTAELHRPEMKLLLLSLILGQSIEQIYTLQVERNADKQIIGVRRKHRLPTIKQPNKVKPLLCEIETSFIQPIPLALTQGLTDLKFNTLSTISVSTVISTINRKHHTHLTQVKVTRMFEQYAHIAGLNVFHVRILKGENIQAHPALYYLQFRVRDLIASYTQYLNVIDNSAKTDVDLKTCGIPSHCDAMIGSPLRLPDEVLSDLFNMLAKEVKRTRTHSRYSEESHNALTLYTQIILALSSGARPVTGWFGYRADYHLPTKEYWISDKAHRLEDNSRVVVLPQQAIHALAAYTDFLASARHHFRHSTPLLATRYQESLTSDAHLMFYRNNGELEEITPSAYQAKVADIFPLQPNWHRHHIRTLLNEHNISDEIAAAWMGHMTANTLSFASFSALSRRDMETVAILLERYLNELNLEVISW